MEPPINQYLRFAISKKASDLHLISNENPVLRVDGEIEVIEEMVALKPEEMKKLAYGILDEKQIKRLEEERELDFAYNIDGSYFRVNLHWQRGVLAMALRIIPTHLPTPEELGFSETIYKLTHYNQGLILVTGPSGAGKSTTLAAMINVINQERRTHIITLEDPIEFVYEKKQSIIEQREIGYDSKSFHNALKYILRQDPNVILVGEMRDLETIAATLTAAETGHLVFSTLHTASAAETVERIIDVFPPDRQHQILVQLASSLRAVVSQQLLPRKDGGRVAAREIMINTPAIANLIRQNNIVQLNSTIQTSAKEGMVTMTSAIKKLLADGVVDEAVAKNRIRDFETMSTYY